MGHSLWKRIGGVAAGLGAVLGCGSLFRHLTDDATPSDGGGGFARVESVFSDAPVSPGGTGGIVTEMPELEGEETRSFFKAFQVDPESEDSAGPKFVVAADIDQDGLNDLVSGWNQSQPVQIHFQRRSATGNISFRSITLAGTTQVGVLAGVEVGQINEDGWLDVVVLSKATGFATFCAPANVGDPAREIGLLDGAILVYFSPGDANLVTDGDSWTEMELINPFIADIWIHDQYPGHEPEEFEEIKTKPEWGGFTSLVVAEIDGVPGDDIIVALNAAECDTIGQLPPTNTVDLWVNPGAGLSEQFDQWGAPIPDNPGRRGPLMLIGDAPQVKDLAVMDIDGDGDLDVIATYTNALSLNVRWARNPQIPHRPGGPSGRDAVVEGVSDGFRLRATQWERRPIGQIDTAADILALGDIDSDGFDDVLVRSTDGQVIQWFRRPNPLVVQPEFPPNDPVPDRFNFPWPVFTISEFRGREPEGLGVGDVTGDGQVDLIASAAGAVFWYDSASSPSVYDPWFGNTIVQDNSNDLDGDGVPDTEDGCPTDPNKIDPGVCGCGLADPDCSTPNLQAKTTHINTLLVVDLDGDGRNDIVATLDRRSAGGLSDDELVWYRNVRTEEDEEGE